MSLATVFNRLWKIDSLRLNLFWKCLFNLMLTASIFEGGDCRLQTYQTVAMMKQAAVIEFTTISPTLYIRCYSQIL